MAKTYRLQYFGGFGLGLSYGDIRDFPEEEAEKLLRDWPRHFKVLNVFEDDPKEPAADNRDNKKLRIRNRKKDAGEASDE